MKRTVLAWFAASSLLLAPVAPAATRPHYGGVLRIALHEGTSSLDPLETHDDSLAGRSLGRLLFDTLVTADGNGKPQAALATEWREPEPGLGSERWEFSIRQGVRFQDGSSLTAEAAAASLRMTNPEWTISSQNGKLIIQRPASPVSLLAELAAARNAIVRRSTGTMPLGTGPFRVTDWQPGRKLTVAANEDYWAGRPYLDAVEIELGRTSADQWTALDLGRADAADIAAGQPRRTLPEGRQMVRSSPVQVVALAFARDAAGPDEIKARDLLAASLDRSAIGRVLFQGEGDASGAMVPNWISGFGFVFSAELDPAKRRELRADIRQVPSWTVGYDPADPLLRLVADRVVLNALDAGLTMKSVASGTADVRIVRVTVPSPDPALALTGIAATLGLAGVSPRSDGPEDLYAAEADLLRPHRVIPLLHLPVRYAVNRGVRRFRLRDDGTWDLENCSMAADSK